MKEIRKFFGTKTSIGTFFFCYSPKKAEALKDIQAVLGFPELKIVKPSYTRWKRMSVVLGNCMELPLFCKPFHIYMSHLEILRHIVYTPFWLVLDLLSEVLSALAFLNICLQKKMPLPFMLKSTLDHLNSIKECDANLCSAAETAILNLVTEHGITIQCSRGTMVRKSPPLSVLGHLLPPKQLSFNLLRILCLFISRRDAAAPQPEEQPAISHSH